MNTKLTGTEIACRMSFSWVTCNAAIADWWGSQVGRAVQLYKLFGPIRHHQQHCRAAEVHAVPSARALQDQIAYKVSTTTTPWRMPSKLSGL